MVGQKQTAACQILHNPDLIRQQQVRFKGAGPIQNKEVCTVTSHSATSWYKFLERKQAPNPSPKPPRETQLRIMILAHRLKVNQLMMTIQSLFCQTQLLRMRRTTLELYLNFTLFWSLCHSGCQHSKGPLLHHLQQQWIIQFTRLVRSCIPNEVGAMVTVTLGLTTHSTQGLN